MSNGEYKRRFDRLSAELSVKPPPSTYRMFPGYLVIRHLGQADEYEPGIPDMRFENSYESVEA